jgi:hypothetical protein
MNEGPSLSRVTSFSSVLAADLGTSIAILSEIRSQTVNLSETLIGIGIGIEIEEGRGNEDVSNVDGGDCVVVARRWIVRGRVEGKAVGIALEERVARIAVEGGSMVFEVEEVVLLEEDIVAAAAGDSSACSLLLWGMETLDGRSVVGEV